MSVRCRKSAGQRESGAWSISNLTIIETLTDIDCRGIFYRIPGNFETKYTNTGVVQARTTSVLFMKVARFRNILSLAESSTTGLSQLPSESVDIKRNTTSTQDIVPGQERSKGGYAVIGQDLNL
ncbi:hypothetical protein RRG08_047504 [Elysia crispata]|uniref:Uncharacterized protein n=1 Tax=Elysia crispata TaxID=231223 RepID=A0AAE1CNP8_9GAST|nr:hypothetical protein RRG08_047504 [Elysia crispata]